jgi:hypothetical protein
VVKAAPSGPSARARRSRQRCQRQVGGHADGARCDALSDPFVGDVRAVIDDDDGRERVRDRRPERRTTLAGTMKGGSPARVPQLHATSLGDGERLLRALRPVSGRG